MEESFQDYLQRLLEHKLQLKINDNRSTMLSVKWEPDCTKVSLHRIFLNAPKDVVHQLVDYLKGKERPIPKVVQHYIETNLKNLDYSHTLDLKKIYTQGDCFDLKILYDQVNREYFANSINLLITWFGEKRKALKPRSRVTLGLFHDQLKLIKINRFLDNTFVPEYVVRFIIYHEMLHYVCPSYIDSKGIHRIHSKEFKEQEERFSAYRDVQNWINNNQVELFA